MSDDRSTCRYVVRGREGTAYCSLNGPDVSALTAERDALRAELATAHGIIEAVSERQMADLLRDCRYVMGRLRTALIAFGDQRYLTGIESECSRAEVMNRRLDGAISKLPPEDPMTPEREQAIGRLLGAVLDKRFGDGTDEAITDAFDALGEPRP